MTFSNRRQEFISNCDRQRISTEKKKLMTDKSATCSFMEKRMEKSLKVSYGQVGKTEGAPFRKGRADLQ